MNAATDTLRYIIPDPQPSSRKEVMEAMVEAARANSEEELFQAIQQLILKTSYCQAPASENLLEIDRMAEKWETTWRLYRQWTTRCYNQHTPMYTRCRIGCR